MERQSPPPYRPHKPLPSPKLSKQSENIFDFKDREESYEPSDYMDINDQIELFHTSVKPSNYVHPLQKQWVEVEHPPVSSAGESHQRSLLSLGEI